MTNIAGRTKRPKPPPEHADRKCMMARSIPTSHLTPADDLRHLLEVSEKRAVNIRGAGPETALELLHWLDRIVALLAELKAEGVDLRSELVRWEALQGAVRRHASDLQAELRELGGLAACRKQRDEAPPPDLWWWWLDAEDRQRRTKTLVRLSLAALALVVLFLAGRWVLHTFFPVDPAVTQALEYRNEGDRWLEQGDLTQAIASYEAALALQPDDIGYLATLAAMYQVTGQTAKAAELEARLLQQVSPSQAHTALAQAMVYIDHPDLALPLAQQAAAEDPQNAQAFLVQADAYEARGDMEQAVNQLQQAVAIAEANNNDEIVAIAKVRLAYLLQRLPVQQSLQSTPNP